MRLLAGVLALAALASNASAQIYKLEFKDEKTAKKFKQFCVEVNDQLYLVFEPKNGISYDEEKHTILYSPQTNEVWVTDMDTPRVCPYRVEKKAGNLEKVKAGGKATVSINGADIKGISIFMKDQTFWGLTQEFAKREDEVGDLRKQRDALKKGTPEWKLKQTGVVQTLERLRSWLDETIYSKYARKIKKEIDSELKASKEANAQRLELCKQSIKIVPTAEDMVRVGKEVYGDAVVFHTIESTHCRIIYREECGDERVKGCAELAESIIDGFRVQFVDPFTGEDYKDYIPDTMFAEFYFGPDDVAQNEKFLGKYYGLKFEGPYREKILNAAGHPVRRSGSSAPGYANTWRAGDQADLEGMVAHPLGHILSNLHYNQDRMSDTPDWLAEGVGNWISLEYLGRNSVQCISFDVGKYATKKKGDGTEDTNLLKGTADIYHRLAIDEGLPIDQLALRRLAEFTDPDVAKSYSLFNFIVKTLGEKGQRWLRALCNAASIPNELVKQWRIKTEAIFELKGVDVFKKLNDDWLAYTRDLIGAPPPKK